MKNGTIQAGDLLEMKWIRAIAYGMPTNTVIKCERIFHRQGYKKDWIECIPTDNNHPTKNGVWQFPATDFLKKLN